MKYIMNFVSGKELEINEKEFRDLPVTLSSKGVKVKRMASGAVVPMNSTTIEFIVAQEEESDRAVTPEPVFPPEMVKVEKELLKTEGLPRMDQQVEKPKPKTSDEIIAEMMEKSNCKHMPEQLELYIQHTAKGIRYFPVCSNCGKRERYVSESKIVKGEYAGTVNDKWTEADIANAKPWKED